MFQDVYLPDTIAGYEFTALPRTNVTIVTAFNDFEQRTRNTLHPLRDFTSPEGVRCPEDVQDLYEHWLIMSGPFNTFPMRDPLDFASRRLVKPQLVPDILGIDQVLGVGDGLTRTFQLKKKYSRGGIDYTRDIRIPIVDTVEVLMNAKDPGTASPTLPGGPYTFTVSRYGGVVTFDHAPSNGVALTVGFLFDCEVRFASNDSFAQVLKAFQASGFAPLDFKEVRFCNDGV